MRGADDEQPEDRAISRYRNAEDIAFANGSIEERVRFMAQRVIDLEHVIYGNGNTGMKEAMWGIQRDISDIKQSILEAKEEEIERARAAAAAEVERARVAAAAEVERAKFAAEQKKTKMEFGWRSATLLVALLGVLVAILKLLIENQALQTP